MHATRGDRVNVKLPKTPDTTTKVSLPLPPGLGERTGRECLVLLHGGTIGRKYDLGPGHWTIGRDPYANIVLDADSVSRAHVRIEVGPEESWVVDGGSGRYRGASGRLLRRMTGDVRFGTATGSFSGSLKLPR